MKKLVSALVVILMLLFVSKLSVAQVPSLVKVRLGFGGGGTLPLGNFDDTHKLGINAGATIRVSGVIPIQFVGSAYYMRLDGEDRIPPIVGSPTFEDGKILQLGAGLEYKLVPAPIVKPYVGGEILYNKMEDIVGPESESRFGATVKAGVELNMGGFVHLDGSVKYQALNLVGKEGGENTKSVASATLSLMFTLM